MNKTYAILFGVLAIAAFSFFFWWPNPMNTQAQSLVLPDGTVFEIEIAESSVDKTRGLSGREELKEGTGMLFVYPYPTEPVIWMPNMHFPIDIIWLRDHRIVTIVENAPPDDSSDRPRYRPTEPADRVLEVPAGTAQKHALNLGDRLEY